MYARLWNKSKENERNDDDDHHLDPAPVVCVVCIVFVDRLVL